MRLPVAVLGLSAAALISLVVHEGYTGHAIIPTKGDVPTYGFGTTTRADGSPVQLGDTITPVEAVNRAYRDITKFEAGLKRCVKVPLSQGEYDVYVDMMYNIGERAFCNSGIVRELNAQRYQSACDQILRWKYVGKQDCSIKGNKICWGLWERRLAAHRACTNAQPENQ